MSHSGKQSDEPATKALAGRRPRSQTQIVFEIGFFASILSRNPDYIDVLRVHANTLTLTCRYEEGLKIDQRLVDLRPSDALAHYNLACSYSLLKKITPALKALRRALELGYHDFRYLREDQDLANVRRDARFRRLLREFERAGA